MTQLFAVDVSHYQGAMDWKRTKAAGVQFAFIKATEGLNWYDPQFSKNVQGARQNGIPFGIYHFWRGLVAPELQLANFMKMYEAIYIGNPIPFAIDIEAHDGLTPKQTKNSLAKLIQLMANELGKLPTIYTSKEKWDKYVEPYERWKELPLWVANWEASTPTLPRDWEERYIWQYEVADAGPAYGAQSAKIDLNRVKPAYLEYYGIGVAHPEPEPQPQEYDITITIDGATYSGKVTKG